MHDKNITELNPQKTTSNEPMVTAEVIGELLSLSARSVYNHFHDDLIPGYRIGKSIRFRVSEVLNAITK